MSPDTDVLVVDDEAAMRTSVADILRSAGYSVIEAEDGQAALDVLATERVTVMVLDQAMPRRTGIEVVSAISPPPTVIMMSAQRIEEGDRELVRGKVQSFLTKPVPPARLLDEVAAAYGEGRT
ncbi:MAG: response regulator [Acidimicrobiales bacterium]